MRLPRSRFVTLMLVAVFVAACSDSTGPGTSAVESLTISGVRINADAFRDNGEFQIGLLAADAAGMPILSTQVGVTAALTEVGSAESSSFDLVVQNTLAETATSAPMYAAILLDDSGSMRSNDPEHLRGEAARLFWQSVLPARATNHVSVMDFGAGSTSGFSFTRLLQDWTRDTTDLSAALDMITASGGTPLYRSMRETSQWIDSTTAANTSRVLLLLSDGLPGDNSHRESSIDAALDANITVHTVGLGPASDADAGGSQAAIDRTREIAERTGGVYSAATAADALGPIFSTLATVSSHGQLVTAFQITPTPAAGTRVSGTVTVSSGGKTGTAVWSFLAP